ncbi:MAG: hypothetical protein E7018_01250 [Alphaproteobacteria bacterium]|nr:hypothetical protein [Alphaproteobacteria bacterium]
MYFTKEWTSHLQMPDGTLISSARQLDKYLQAHDMSLSTDYSDTFLQERRRRNEKAQRSSLFSDFIHNYKRSIWQ